MYYSYHIWSVAVAIVSPIVSQAVEVFNRDNITFSIHVVYILHINLYFPDSISIVFFCGRFW